MQPWKHLGNTLFTIAIIGTLGTIFYVNRDRYVPVYEDLFTYFGIYKPCSKPIIYYIDGFNPKFGITEEQLKNNLEKASSIWNNALNKELLRNSKEEAEKMFDLSKRKLAINLIYDHRQATTEKLKNIDSTININKDSYENQKLVYDELKIQYNNKKQLLQKLITEYENNKINYQKEISNLNNRNNLSNKQYSEIESKRLKLNTDAEEINKTNKELNQIVEKLNSLVAILNSMNKEINLNINTFNNVSLSNGPEFQEGEYVIDDFGQRINIYEFKDQNKLIRVLAHEFGHAIGIDHVENKNSIMNAYNSSDNIYLTEEDLNALKIACQVK